MSLKVLEITLLVEIWVFALWRFRQGLGRPETRRQSDNSNGWFRGQSSTPRGPDSATRWKVQMLMV